MLLVDDNVDALVSTAEALRLATHDVRTAGDGPAALTLVDDFKPDVAILDIGLPGMDGYELAGRLRAKLGKCAPRLIAMTGYGQEADRKRSEERGFDLHLVKPVDVNALLRGLIGRAPPKKT